MAMIDVQDTLADLVTAGPERAAALGALGLDHRSHGHRTLIEACRAAGVDVWDVVARLEESDRDNGLGWAGVGAGEPVDHLAPAHLRPLRREALCPLELGRWVHDVHGDLHPELAAVTGGRRAAAS
jgi:iron-sulfur cluster repair protein YtfE (RIC family)